MLSATWNVIDKVLQLLLMLWVSAVLIAMNRYWMKWRYLGPIGLVGHIWRGEIGIRWRPIETAAMTGEVRLLACEDGRVVIGFWGWERAGAVGTETWRDQKWKPVRPTHWMPVPKLPR